MQKKKLSSNTSTSPVATEGPKAFNYSIPDIDAEIAAAEVVASVSQEPEVQVTQPPAQQSEPQTH